jgi:hypothetical protein
MERQPHLENGKRRLFAGVAGGTLAVLAGGVVLMECADPGDGGAITARSPVAATVTRSALSDPAESCPTPTPVPPLTDPDSGITCHASVCTPQFCARGDISALNKPTTDPDKATIDPLLQRLLTLDCSPHSIPPVQIFAEADPVTNRSLLFQYYLLDSTGFQPSVFTTKIKGLNDDPSTQKTVWGANCNLPTIGSVRLALEPKPDLPTDPDDPRAFIDIFTDIRGLFVINNESGWYEGWMIHDLRVPAVDKHAKEHPGFGLITEEDAERLKKMGHGNNVPGNFFTVDGRKPHFPSPADHFPDRVTNVVPIQLSMGAYNSLQQSDAHNYWEFNYQTNWIHPLYELPFAGGFPDHSATEPADTYRDGEIGLLQSIVPGLSAGENRIRARAVAFGDNPDSPRDPDRFDSDIDAQREFRERFVPSGIANEAFLNAFERLASFEPGEHDLERRLLDGYRAAVALVDTNHDGIVSAAEGDIDTLNPNCPPNADGVQDNTCIFLLPRTFNRFAVTREINDGLLAPRFAPSTRAWVLSGAVVTGFAPFGASAGEDADDR